MCAGPWADWCAKAASTLGIPKINEPTILRAAPFWLSPIRWTEYLELFAGSGSQRPRAARVLLIGAAVRTTCPQIFITARTCTLPLTTEQRLQHWGVPPCSNGSRECPCSNRTNAIRLVLHASSAGVWAPVDPPLSHTSPDRTSPHSHSLWRSYYRVAPHASQQSGW